MAKDTAVDANKNRIIYIQGKFDEEKAEKIITSLFDLESLDPTRDILLYIDSFGGSVHSFLAIHDVIRHALRVNVATICVGKAVSCGQMLLMSGTKGKRFITPNSRVVIHEMSCVYGGSLIEVDNALQEVAELQKIFNSLTIKYTKINKKQLSEILQKDSYFSAQEALALGIVDHIVDCPSVLYRELK
jgi:ATP-dependent Clp protease, protease subunit